MTSVQSFIRDEVNRGAFPAPKDAEAFNAYAIASGSGLIPEMENAARQTLDHPMTFEILGEGLRLFDGWALRDLANFRRRYRDHLVSCFESFLKTNESLFTIWTPCALYLTSYTYHPFLPSWLAELFQQHLNKSRKAFSRPLFNPRNIRGEYLLALKNHLKSYNCDSCSISHSLDGEAFCKELEDRLAQALSEVCTASFFWENCGSLNIRLT
jgi:hypothetical protein